MRDAWPRSHQPWRRPRYPTLNETHDPALPSGIASANDGRTDFPIRNLPFAIFRRKGSSEAWRGGVAIGDQIVDPAATAQTGAFSGDAPAPAAVESTLDQLMGMEPQAASALRKALSKALQAGSWQQVARQPCRVAQAAAGYTLPCRIDDHTGWIPTRHPAPRWTRPVH
ncbi:MAG TPA: hypothetical protein PKA16_09285 [Ottowia sp.]|uniref:hypothetical protein n=1 Tax=Ottowia sp. TaxID=1898956 RepID=UPI002BE5F5F3|nr:hypothetical protein [Ottowia sp.]HMN21574.1 hypothetical protein [Ottowia sp.]